MTLNFREICRLCMVKKEGLTPLFQDQVPDNVTSLSAKIMNFVPVIKLCADDGLPGQVCARCSRLVNLSYKFKLQCENSDTTLRQYLKSNPKQDGRELIQCVFRNDNEDNWSCSVIKNELQRNSSDDDFDGQWENSEALSSQDDVPYEGSSVNEWKNISAASLIKEELSEECKTYLDCTSRGTKRNAKIYPSKSPIERKKRKNIHPKKSIRNTTSVIKPEIDISEEKVNLDTPAHDNEKKESIKKKARREKKGFLCQDCGKNFSYEQHLLLHRRTHTGEKPFACSVCGERFSVTSNLNKHMRIHTGEKPFLCTVCGNSFSRSDTLTKHMRSHTGEKPFHCDVCGNSFGRRSVLTNHMRTHSGEKPYLCTQCGQRFAQSYDLTKHMRSHTGEKPYKCTMCRMSFVQKTSLTKHLKTHAVEVPFTYLDFSKAISYRLEPTSILPHQESEKLLPHF